MSYLVPLLFVEGSRVTEAEVALASTRDWVAADDCTTPATTLAIVAGSNGEPAVGFAIK